MLLRRNDMILTTSRCVLCTLVPTDIPALLPLFTSSEVRQYLGGSLTSEEAENRLHRWCRQEYYWTVRTENICIGLVDLSPYHDPLKTELSYQFLPAYWGQGYAFETLSAVLDWCRGRYDSVVSETQEANIRSCRLLEKLGYRLTDRPERFGAVQRLYEKQL